MLLTRCVNSNNAYIQGCQASLCCESSFIQNYRNCLECISQLLDGSSTTNSTKSAVNQLLTSCIQVGALPPPPTTSQDHTNHTSYAMASQTGSQLSPTNSPATGTGVVSVPPASSVISPTSPFSGSQTSTASVGATPSSTNSAVRTTVGQAYSGIATVLAWAILQMM
ncbi:hypothetical protein M404DRAFT_894961 [Pisolithus tinctorius Marx 270]|uniref:Uncharacterized protein n=1 Tax=Pisolithus tinctorius Marx 270 TaxID=870435 RepID=A0A0C3N8Q4_PISTI|nr:hypothetical protein M404DRAFT_894961 [Pisolithus tinctorius Marx 270]